MSDKIKGDITLNADQIKFITQCEAIAEKRGHAHAIADAVRVVEAIPVTSHGNISTWDAARMRGIEEALAALRALSLSDSVMVPAIPTEKMMEAGSSALWEELGEVARPDCCGVIYRAMLAAIEE